MLSARNIHKRFGALEVLKGIDLDIADGKVTTIVGPSGAGKTTLLQILGTLSSPEAGGRVLYDGVDVTTLSDKKLSAFRNRNIGFVFQFPQLRPAMSATIGGAAHRDAIGRAEALLDRLGLGDRAGHRPSELSGGECQRAAVARALVNSPRVVLADEPSGSLDWANRASLHRLFFELRDELGATFVIVTHDEGLAADSDAVIRMADGRIVGIETNQKHN